MHRTKWIWSELDGVKRVCTSSCAMWRVKTALLFIGRLGFADLRSVYSFLGAFVLFFTGGYFFRLGLNYLEFRVIVLSVCCVLTLCSFFPGKGTTFILFRV